MQKNDYEYRITNPWMDTAGTAKGDDDIPEIKDIFDNIFHC